MFVSAKKYRRLQMEHQELKLMYQIVNAQLDSMEFELDATCQELVELQHTWKSPFTTEQLKSIRRMVHPDRNPGNTQAHEITQIINGIVK